MMTPAVLLKLRTPLYTLMRVAFGLLFWFHGAQKLFGWFGGQRMPLGTRMGLAGIIEFVCGLAIALGFLTSFAALIAAGEMAAAYLITHAARGTWPIANGGEMALLYMFAFLFIMTEGGGLFSLDAYLSSSRVRRRF